MIVRFLVLGFALVALPVSADSLQIHGLSQHTEPGDYVERNYGIGYTWTHSRYVRTPLSLLRNSHGEPSLHGCMMFGSYVSAGPCTALGYENDIGNGEVLPYPLISVRPLTTRISPRVNIIPLGNGEYVYEVSIDIRLGG